MMSLGRFFKCAAIGRIISAVYGTSGRVLRLVAPNGQQVGAPVAFMWSGIPFVIPAGDGGANGLSFTGGGDGAFTLSSAIMSGLVLPHAYFLLPANAGGSGCAAGWYYGTMSSATTGVIYANSYDPTTEATPTAPESLTSFTGSPSGRLTQGTSQYTLMRRTLPGGSLGLNGWLDIRYKMLGSTTSGTKLAQVKIGSTVAHSYALTTSSNVHAAANVQNAGDQHVQVATKQNNGYGSQTGTIAGDILSIDTSVDQVISFVGQLYANTETLVLVPQAVSVTYVG